MTDQKQKSGDSSLNIQAAGGVSITVGVSAAEARQIAEDVWHRNALQLAADAKVVAELRRTHVTDQFVKKMIKDNPAGLEQAKDPDFQHGLFIVQKEFARSGDVDLGTLLVELLVDRSKQPIRNVRQIVLNEALSVAPKLTDSHLAALSIIFFFRYTAITGLPIADSLYLNLDKYAKPFVDQLDDKTTTYQHMQYAGCGAVDPGTARLEETFRKNYGGFFSKGFTEAEFKARGFSSVANTSHPVFVTCVNDKTRRQVKGLNEPEIQQYAPALLEDQDDIHRLCAQYRDSLMDNDAVRATVIANRGYMERVFDVWNKTPMKRFHLTSVGMTLGHANIKKLAGEFTDLSIWIN